MVSSGFSAAECGLNVDHATEFDEFAAGFKDGKAYFEGSSHEDRYSVRDFNRRPYFLAKEKKKPHDNYMMQCFINNTDRQNCPNVVYHSIATAFLTMDTRPPQIKHYSGASLDDSENTSTGATEAASGRVKRRRINKSSNLSKSSSRRNQKRALSRKPLSLFGNCSESEISIPITQTPKALTTLPVRTRSRQ